MISEMNVYKTGKAVVASKRRLLNLNSYYLLESHYSTKKLKCLKIQLHTAGELQIRLAKKCFCLQHNEMSDGSLNGITSNNRHARFILD